MAPWAPTSSVVVLPWRRNERGALAGLKTISYLENGLGLRYATERGADEGIFANTVGNLCEGCGTNVFVVHDGQLVTPPLSAGCLAGVTRGLVLEWVPGIVEARPADRRARDVRGGVPHVDEPRHPPDRRDRRPPPCRRRPGR